MSEYNYALKPTTRSQTAPNTEQNKQQENEPGLAFTRMVGDSHHKRRVERYLFLLFIESIQRHNQTQHQQTICLLSSNSDKTNHKNNKCSTLQRSGRTYRLSQTKSLFRSTLQRSGRTYRLSQMKLFFCSQSSSFHSRLVLKSSARQCSALLVLLGWPGAQWEKEVITSWLSEAHTQAPSLSKSVASSQNRPDLKAAGDQHVPVIGISNQTLYNRTKGQGE